MFHCLCVLSHFTHVWLLWPHGLQPARLLCPWDSPGKKTGVGCHFLLQCMKVKSESEVAHPCPVLSDPMDCSLPGSSVYGIFQARVLEWGAICLLQVFLFWATQKCLRHEKPSRHANSTWSVSLHLLCGQLERHRARVLVCAETRKHLSRSHSLHVFSITCMFKGIFLFEFLLLLLFVCLFVCLGKLEFIKCQKYLIFSTI